MTVSSETASTTPAATDGSVRVWPFTFRIDSIADVQLVLIDEDGNETVQEQSTYTGSGFGQDQGGEITWPATGAAQASGYTVRIDRKPAFTQLTDLRNQGGYHPEIVETIADKGAFRDQYLHERLKRLVSQVSALALVVAGLGAVPEPEVDVPFITSAFLGLAANGATDDGPLIQRKIDELAEAGRGGYLLLDGQIRCDGQLRVWGGVSLSFVSPQRYGKYGGCGVRGKIAATSVDNLRLLQNASAGATEIYVDTALEGGAALSALFNVGNRFTIYGLRDSCGYARQWGEHKITAIDDAAKKLTITPALEFAYDVSFASGAYETAWGTPNVTLIQKQLYAALQSSILLPTNTVTCTASGVGSLAIGDWVLAEDDKKASDVAGSSVNRIHRAMAQIVDIDGQSVVLDRVIEHPLSTSFDARLTVVDAATGTISGVAVENVEAPDASSARVWPVDFELAYGSFIFDASLPNEDAYGQRGQCRIKLSADCYLVDPDVANPIHVDAGNGYGCSFEYATDCGLLGGVFRGCRHSIVFQGSTRCRAHLPRSYNCKLSDIDFHGCEERGCGVLEPRIIGGSETVSLTRSAIAFGNNTHLAGTYGCWVKGGSVRHYKSSEHSAYGIDFACANVEDCFVEGTRFVDVAQLFQVLNHPTSTTLTNKRCGLRKVEVDGCSTWIGWAEGNKYGAPANYPIEGFYIEKLRARNLTKLFKCERIKGLRIVDLDIDQVTTDATEPYVARFEDVTSLLVQRPTVRGTLRGFQCTNCTPASAANGKPPRIHDAAFHDLTHGEILSDAGGNAGLEFWGWSASGFTATSNNPLASAGMSIGPRSISDVSVADDAKLIVKPPQPTGLVDVWTASGDHVRIRYLTGAGGGSTKIGGDANGAAGALDVDESTATDTTLTVAPRTDGNLNLINRRGGTRGVQWAFA